MSNIDERIVRMKFDNAQFERGVEESLNSIERLNKQLDSTESARSLEGLTKASNNVDLSGIEKAVDHISDRFSVFGTIATTILANIATQAFQTGEALVKSLSIDNITAGWEKYDQEVQAVQTIMVTLGDTTSMDQVEKELEKLSWFSDETSYSYTQMTDSLAKFISAGMGMEDSVTAVMGLANAAAAAGVSTQKASSAFYNFSQAMGTGYMGLQDWRSIELLNMATPQFKQNILDSAVALGRLKTTIDDTGETLYYYDKAEEAFSANGLRASLKDRWLDQDVMMDVLKRYGEFSDKVQELQNEYDYDQASSVIRDAERLGLALDTFSARAFMAAQEAKTFQEAIDATKDAVSTKWKETFSYIFGNYEEAKVLWTDFSEFLYNIFASSGDQRNELLEKWKDLGGRDNLIEGFYNIMESLLNIVNAVRDAWHEIFPPMEAERLITLTERFKNLTEALKITEDRANTIKKILLPIFRVLRFIINTIKDLFTNLKKLGPPLSSLFDKFKELVGPLWDKIRERFENSSFFSGIDTSKSFISIIIDFIAVCITKIRDGIDKLQDLLGPIWDKVRDKLLSSSLFSSFNTDNTFFTALSNMISSGFKTIKGGIDNLKEIKIDFTGLKRLKDRLVDFKTNGLDVITSGFSKFGELFKGFKTSIEKTLGQISTWFTKSKVSEEADNNSIVLAKVSDGFTSLETGLSEFIKKIEGVRLGDVLGASIFVPIFIFAYRMLNLINSISISFGESISKLISSFTEAISGITGAFTSIKAITKAKARELNSKAILNFVISISVLIGAIILLSNFADQNNIGKAIDTVAQLMIAFIAFVGIVNVLQTVLNKTAPGITWSKSGISLTGFGKRTGLISLAVSLLAIVLAIKFMSDLLDKEGSVDRIWNIIGMLGAIAAGLLAFSTMVFAMGDGHRLGLQTFYPLVMIAAALGLIRILKQLDTLELENPLRTIATLTGILIALTVFSKLAAKASGGSKSILHISSSIIILALALKVLNTVAKNYDTRSFFLTLFAAALMTGIALLSKIIDSLDKVHIIEKGQKFRRQGNSILKICVGLLAVTVALRAFKDVEWGTILKAIAAWGMVMLGLAGILIASKNASEEASKMAKSIGGIVTMLAISISILSLVLKYNPQQVVQAAVIISGLLLVIAGVLRLALPANTAAQAVSTKFITAITSLLFFVSALLVAIYLFDDKGKMANAATILSLLFISIATIIRTLTKYSSDISHFKNTWATLGTIFILLTMVTLAVIGLADQINDASQLPKAGLAMIEIAAAIALLLVGFGLFTRLASALLTLRPSAVLIGAAGFAIVIAAITGAMILASKFIDTGNLQKIAEFGPQILLFIGAMVAVEALVGLIGMFLAAGVLPGLLGMAEIIVFLGILAEVMAGIGSNFSDEDLQSCLNHIDTMTVILGAAARLVSVAVANLLFGGLPTIAVILSEFAVELKSFSDAVGNLPSDFKERISNFGAAMLSLAWYSNLFSLVDDLFMAHGLKTFVSKLSEVVPDIISFLKELSGLNNIDTAVMSIDAIGSLIQKMTYINPYSAQTKLTNLSKDISTFFDNIRPITLAQVQKVDYLATMLKSISSKNIDYSRFNSDMGSAGYQLASLSSGLLQFAQNTTNPQLFAIASEATPYVVRILSELSKAEADISPNKGIWPFIKGQSDLGIFGQHLSELASGMSAYVKAIVDNFTDGNIEIAKSRTPFIVGLISDFANIENTLSPATGSLDGLINGYKDIGAFASRVASIVPDIKKYVEALLDVKHNDLVHASNKTIYISKILSDFGAFNNLIIANNANKMVSIAKKLPSIAEYISKYTSNIISEANEINRASGVTAAIVNMISSLVNAEQVADIEAFGYALERIITVGLDEWLEVFKNWPQQDKLKNAVKDFTTAIEDAFTSAETGTAIQDALLAPIHNLLSAVKGKGTSFYNAGRALTEQLMSGLNSLKLEYTSEVKEIAEIPNEILSSVSETEVQNNGALSQMLNQFKELKTQSADTKEAIVGDVEAIFNKVKEKSPEFITGFYSPDTSNTNFMNYLGDAASAADIEGAFNNMFNWETAGNTIGEKFGGSIFGGLSNYLTADSTQWTDMINSFLPDLQSMMDLKLEEMGGLTVPYSLEMADGSTVADLSSLMDTSYGPNIQVNTDALSDLTSKVTILNGKLDTLTLALENQKVTHTGTLNVKYTNQQGLIDDVQRAIVNGLRSSLRG